jgi:molybdopterin molybdotransferase
LFPLDSALRKLWHTPFYSRTTIENMSPEAAPSLIPSYAEAARIVQSRAKSVIADALQRVESVALPEARGRVLAEDVIADRDQPPFDRSTRDGYACRAVEANSGSLRIAGIVRAGEVWADAVLPRETIEIMTGAPVPKGADCVGMLEHMQRNGSSVKLQDGRKLSAGENIVPAGVEARKGNVLLATGTRMSAQHIAVAASCGKQQLQVIRKPRILVQATGDELVDLADTPQPFQIRNSNSYSLQAQVEACGGAAIVMPILRDDRQATENAISAFTADWEADLLILSGGVSMGKFDYVEASLKKLGAEFFFTGAKIQPGKPVVFGRLRRAEGGWLHFFGLPGNPISTMVTFALFVQPLIHALSGEARGAPRFALARLNAAVRLKKGLTRFLPAFLETANPAPDVRVLPWQGSGDLATNAQANCYLVVPDALEDGREELPAGEIVSILLIG